MNGVSMMNRKSTRAFMQGKTISNDLIKDILYYALIAPSAHNRQPWLYVVIKDEKKKEFVNMLNKALESGCKNDLIKKNIKMIKHAIRIFNNSSVVLLVFNNLKNFKNNIENEYNKYENNMLIDDTYFCWVNDIISIGTSIENLLLRATENGIDSVCIGYILYLNGYINSFLNIHKELVTSIALGYGCEGMKYLDKKSIEDNSIWYE